MICPLMEDNNILLKSLYYIKNFTLFFSTKKMYNICTEVSYDKWSKTT
jgi:Tfp pilus assembly protein PilZ